jgi:hypothetical protein
MRQPNPPSGAAPARAFRAGRSAAQARPRTFAAFYPRMREELRKHYRLKDGPDMEHYARIRWQRQCLDELLATLPGLREPAPGDPLATLAWLTRITRLEEPLDRAKRRAMRQLFRPENQIPDDA